MKKGIHPEYHQEAIITCGCGAVIKTSSTREKMDIDICASCHPFYTGKKKRVDSTGRVDRFEKISKKSEGLLTKKRTKKEKLLEKSKRKAEKIATPSKLTKEE